MRIQRPASAPDKPPARRSFKLRCTALPCRGRLHRRRIDAGRRGGRRGRRGGGGGGARRGRREVRNLHARARQQRVRLRHRRVQVRVGPRVASQRLLRQAPTRQLPALLQLVTWGHSRPVWGTAAAGRLHAHVRPRRARRRTLAFGLRFGSQAADWRMHGCGPPAPNPAAPRHRCRGPPRRQASRACSARQPRAASSLAARRRAVRSLAASAACVPTATAAVTVERSSRRSPPPQRRSHQARHSRRAAGHTRRRPERPCARAALLVPPDVQRRLLNVGHQARRRYHAAG